MASSEMNAGKSEGRLFSKMMKSIHTQHSWGNTLRLLKLPFIFLDRSGTMYAGAIAQFYFLTKHLEHALALNSSHPWVETLLALKMDRTRGYEMDLQQLLGSDWLNIAESIRTPATNDYCHALDTASPESLVAAGFILYGALVVGGGKATQAKVRGIFPTCDHVLFDFVDLKTLRKDFRRFFDGLGKDGAEGGCNPTNFLPTEASLYMGRNNDVILSVRCVSNLVRVVLASALVASIASYFYWPTLPATTAQQAVL